MLISSEFSSNKQYSNDVSHSLQGKFFFYKTYNFVDQIDKADTMTLLWHKSIRNLKSLFFLNSLISHHILSVNSILSQFYQFQKTRQIRSMLKEFLLMPLNEKSRISLGLSQASKLFVSYLAKRSRVRKSFFVLLILNQHCKLPLSSTPYKDTDSIEMIFLACSFLMLLPTIKIIVIMLGNLFKFKICKLRVNMFHQLQILH